MSDSIVDDLGSSFTIEWYHNRQIVLCALNDSRHQAVDAVFEFLTNLIEMWPSERPYLSIYDATRSRFSFNPYLRHKATELMRRYPDKDGRTAILLPQTLLGQVLRLFVNVDLLPLSKGREIRIFFSRDEALDWLLEAL